MVDNLDVVDRVFTFPDTDEDITLNTGDDPNDNAWGQNIRPTWKRRRLLHFLHVGLPEFRPNQMASPGRSFYPKRRTT